ncbi:hypothetical protein IAT40_006993 [Kwoniella sp. CBS 6097]
MDSAYDFATGAKAHNEAALPKAKDFSDHLNRVTKNRAASTLKELYKYQSVPGMIVMAGGIPHPEVFPFETLSATVLAHDAFPLDPPRVPKKNKSVLSWLFGSPRPTISFSIPKYAPKPTDATTIQLSTSLQYAAATGPPALPLFLREYVSKIYRPAYADWDVLVNVGATDGWSKIVNMLVELGDAILVEEWTYPSAENTFLAYECERVPVKMDAEGILPENLEKVLSEWDEEKRGKRRPRILYTIPTGQNPTGATMQLDRKKKIYEICSKFDVIICEDEPYYCLTFSKTSAPGSRLGWITANPLFIERLTRISEISTQAPSGFATAMTTVMLQQWGFDGYIRWLRGVKATYNMRKTWICDAFADTFHLKFDQTKSLFPTGTRTITCYSKQEPRDRWDEKPAGMFIFLGVHVSEHPDYDHLVRKGEDATQILVQKLWTNLADNLVLFAPGWYFDAGGEHAIGGNGYGYFRLSFSIATYEETYQAIERFAKVLDKFFQVK